MRRLRKRDIPIGAALTVAALVLLASVVTGREDERSLALPVQPAPTTATTQSAAADELEMERLKRPKQESPPPDLFASRPPPQPAIPIAAVAKPAPPPAPTAPPLPFKYLGRMIDNGKAVVFLERGQESLVVAAGETIEGTYRVENIGDSAVQFVYLPLGARQILSIPAQF